MSGNGGTGGDVNLVLHVILGVAIVGLVAVALGYVVPELFDRHSGAADIGAVIVVVGTLGFAYVAGRHVWRSSRATIGEGE